MLTAEQILNQIVGSSRLTIDQALATIVGQPAPAWGGTSTGSANAQAIAPSRAITAYTAGLAFSFLAGYTNSGAATLAVSGLTPKTIQQAGSALSAGAITAGQVYTVIYDGSYFQLQGARASSAGTSLYNLFVDAEIISFQQLSAASGDTDLGTVPAGEKWMLVSIYHYNPTGGTLSYTPRFKRSGTYYTTFAAQSVATTVSGVQATITLPILEEGESLSVNTTGAGLHLEFAVLKFSATSLVSSYTNLSLSTGDNKLFECPTGYSALAFSTASAAVMALNALVALRNPLGSSVNFYLCRVPVGGSTGAPGSGTTAIGAATLVGAFNSAQIPAAGTLAFVEGEALWINATNSGALATVKIALFPNA